MKNLGEITIDVNIQEDQKLDIWIAHEGSSGLHYTDITPDEAGRMLADEIECLIEAKCYS